MFDDATCGSCSDDVWDDVEVVSESTFIAVVLVNVSVVYPFNEWWWCVSSPDSKSEWPFVVIAEFVVGNNDVAWLGFFRRCGESFLLLKQFYISIKFISEMRKRILWGVECKRNHF